MDPCIEVVEKLSQREKNSILAVLQRDDKIRVTQEQKIRRLKRDIHDIRMCSVLRAGDDQNKMCLRCRSELGFLFNRGALCPACKFKVCKSCQEVMFNGSWLCQLCYKQRQLKWLTGEWAASFEQNPLRRWASGSDLIKPGLQLIPGAPTIDIDEPRSSQQNNNTDRKAIRNGVSRAEQEKTRVEVPKEGDQLKLTELFNVLRVKKPSDEVPLPETQVRKVTSRRYSESDSDSSSNSDVEVRSSSTGFSMTESEFDTRRIDSPIIEETVSPRRMESPLKSRDSPTYLDSTNRFTSEHSERHESQQKFHLQFQNESHPQHTGSDTNYEIHRPVPAPRSPKPSPRRLQVDQYDTSAHGQSAVRSTSPRTHEVKVEQEREAMVSKSVEQVCKSDTESLREEKMSVNLSEHVVKTKESLDQKREIEKSKSPSLEYIRINENQMVVRPKTRDRARKPDENIKQVRSDTNTPRAEHYRKRNEPKSDKDSQRPIPKTAANRKYTIPNDQSKPDENHSNNISENDMFISQSKHGETESESAQSLGQLTVPRTGSPYSISMDSIPSSHPSPTLQRISISESLPDSSDNDSVSKHSLQDINERTGAKEGDDYVEEEISKVRFRRMSKTLEKMAVISNMAKSPKKKLAAYRVDSPQAMSETGSQDDSGHVSGGSRGTTPEHKRTDSNYSQSSIPSTLSTVTDDDEDIDSLVAKVKQKQVLHGSRGNLLSVFGDSRESLASYYSDAGDIAYSNVPVTGEILLSINYNHKTGMLKVGIKNCRDIAVADSRRKKTDPYVKTYLLPDRTRNGKRKTKVKKHTTSPQFDETLKYQLTSSELSNRTLWVTVWHNDRFGRNTFLGEVTINFEYYKFDDPFPRWYPLQERIDSQPSSMMVYKGDLSVSLRFVPKEKQEKASTSTARSSKGSGKGRLEVLIKEARNLTGVKYNGFSDPFCKGYLLPEKNRGSKQKTPVIRKECNPVWNHTFTFDDISLMELRERSLELTIWDHEKLSSNDFLGGARLNLGSGMSQGKPVDWMDARGEEMSIWQAMLDRPNLWIDGALILRPNMDKRKY